MSPMAIGHGLPISESIGVFVGVAGFDWLADGHAEPLKALGLALAAGTVIFVTRGWMKRRRKD